MKLTYRGASYEYNQPSLEVRESDILTQNRSAYQRCRTLQENGLHMTYRGVKYTTDQMAAAFSPAPSHRAAQALSYRGVKYVRLPDGSTQLVEPGRPVVVPHVASLAVKELSRVHQENLRRNLERRLQAAKARGDQGLVSILEAESRELAL